MADQHNEQAQDNDDAQAEGPIPVEFPTNPERMWLSPQERQRALEIKAAVRADPEIDPLSDFMYAQYAIVSLIGGEGEMELVLDKIRGLQYFKQEHTIMDTCSHGQQVISRLCLDVTPGTFLCFGFSPSDHSFYNVRNMTTFDSSVFHEENTHLWMRGEYYMKHAAYPDFEAIRRGLTTLFECQGYDWKDQNMFNIRFMRQAVTEFAANYPLHYKALKFYNTGVLINVALSSVRRILPSLINSSFEFGCKFEPGRFEDVFMVPNREAASQRLVQQFSKALVVRYRNEASFSLGGENDE